MLLNIGVFFVFLNSHLEISTYKPILLAMLKFVVFLGNVVMVLSFHKHNSNCC